MIKDLDLFAAPLSGISLVEAGAGTGKTYNIAALFVRAILERKLLPSQILVLTYTEAATAELKLRLRNRIRESISALQGQETDDPFLVELKKRFGSGDLNQLQSALYHFDEASISTIHGFCQLLLKEKSVEFGVSGKFEILTDENELLQDVVDNFWRGFIRNEGAAFNRTVIHFINDLEYTPERVLSAVKEILSKDYATFVPETRPLNDFKEDVSELVTKFESLQESFLKEEKDLLHVLNSDSLNGNKYQNRFTHLQKIKEWLNSGYIPIKPHDRLYLFSSFMKTEKEGLKKGKSIPDLTLFSIVDEYLELSNKLQGIELSFIKTACDEISLSYKKAKELKDVLTYNDLLTAVNNGIRGTDSKIAKELRRAYPVALIDEFQDTDPVQYSIFNNIYSADSGTALFMIGDPKQAIYSFRGADINTYFKAKEDAHQDQKYSLGFNYRSSESMINAVNRVFNHTDESFSGKALTFYPAKFPPNKDTAENKLFCDSVEQHALQFIQIEPGSNSADETRWGIAESVSQEVLDLLVNNYSVNDAKIQPSEIAVLVRTHRQALEIQEALRSRNIKSLIKSRESVYQTTEAEDLYLILSAINTPGLEQGVRAALSTELLGFLGIEVKELLDNEKKWMLEYSKFLDLKQSWNRFGFGFMMDELLDLFSIEKNLTVFFNAERRLTNIYHLIELLEAETRQKKLSPSGLLTYFRKKREKGQSSVIEEELIRLESDDDLVQIVTMHTSKGLEYSVVFCPYLWEGIDIKDKSIFTFHRDEVPFIDIGSKGEQRIRHRIQFLKEALSERIRLTYVALTRSKSACMVYFVADSSFELSPIASLLQGFPNIENRISDKLTLNSRQYKIKYSEVKDELLLELDKIALNESIAFRKPRSIEGLLTYENAEMYSSYSVLNSSRINLDIFPRVTSFSALSDTAKDEYIPEEREGFDYNGLITNQPDHSILEKSQFSLPKGAKTGTLLHTIFEEIQFNDNSTFSEVIAKNLDYFGFDEGWNPVLEELIQSSVNHELLDGIKLKDFSDKDILVEMEFHFPIFDTSASELITLIRGEESQEESIPFFGYMKGFVDLIFQKKGKYFILDYKSNYLGDKFNDYDPVLLEKEIRHANYDLQYHIYTVALHRMLKNSIPGYSYEDHFGGVIYLFLRGIDKSTPQSGVFFHKPDEKIVQGLDEYFSKGESL